MCLYNRDPVHTFHWVVNEEDQKNVQDTFDFDTCGVDGLCGFNEFHFSWDRKNDLDYRLFFSKSWETGQYFILWNPTSLL